MRKSRTMQGAYANWTLTLTTEPVENEEPLDVPDTVMKSIADSFGMAVNCYELSREVDRLGSKPR